jgi:hypothetical protein
MPPNSRGKEWIANAASDRAALSPRPAAGKRNAILGKSDGGFRMEGFHQDFLQIPCPAPSMKKGSFFVIPFSGFSFLG